jgi:enoyl-CoA hydratase
MLIERVRRAHTEVLALNRPDAANSLNPQLLDELGRALQEIREDDEVRALVLTGAGKRVFCAGMDLAAAEAAVRPTWPLRHLAPMRSRPSWEAPTPSR